MLQSFSDLTIVSNRCNENNKCYLSLICIKEVVIISLLCFVLFGTTGADETVFAIEPKQEPYYATDGDDGPILECSVASRYLTNGRNLQWTKVINGSPSVLTMGDQNYFSKDYELISSSAGVYNLRIKKIAFEKDNGFFFCSLYDLNNSRKNDARTASVVVLVRPSRPEIEKNLPSVAREEEMVEATCTSRNGNPPPSFTWLFENDTRLPSQWHTTINLSRPHHTTSSTVKWRVKAEHNGAYLICQIWNKAIGERAAALRTETRRINVQYKPRVTVGPVEDYNVEEGERAKLTCDAKANPAPAQYVWEQVGGAHRWMSKDKEFVVEKSDKGQFACSVTNSVGTGRASLHLDVLYAPEINVHSNLSPAEGDDLILSCGIDANPSADSVTWSGPNGVHSDNEILQLKNVTRFSSGNYTCSARNTLTLYSARAGSIPRSGTAVTFVDVRHSPGKAEISISRMPVIVGDEVTLTCTLDDMGSPEARFKWAAPGKDFKDFKDLQLHSTPSYTISKVQLTDAGRYQCLPWNVVGDGHSASLLLEVIEPARLTSLLPVQKFLNETDVGPTLQCSADGHPAPNITWYKDGRQIDAVQSKRWITDTDLDLINCADTIRCSFPVTGRLVWQRPVTWLDKGRYTCKAYNNAGEAHSSDMILKVTHWPVILNGRYPDEALAAVDMGKTAELSCRVSARPDPTFRWYRHSQVISAGERYVISVNRTKDEIESILQISTVTETDLGQYMCSAVNAVRNTYSDRPAQIVINLQRKNKPQTPTNARSFDISCSWMLIGWTAGFDGGHEQTFTLEYGYKSPWPGGPHPANHRVRIRHGSMTVRLVSDDIDRSKRSLTDKSRLVRPFVTYNLTDLVPLSSYWYRIKSENSMGDTDWSSIVEAESRDVTESADVPSPEEPLFDGSSKRLSFKKVKKGEDYCLMIYAKTSVESPLRSVNCTAATADAVNVRPATSMTVRLCRLNPPLPPLICSPMHTVSIVSRSTAFSALPWPIILPVLTLLIFFVLIVAVLSLCCRTRTSRHTKTNPRTYQSNRRPDYNSQSVDRVKTKVSGPYQSEGNATVHGSQTDSGVFTLASQPKSQSANADTTVYQQNDATAHAFANDALRSSYEDGFDRWASAADTYNYGAEHPYLFCPNGYEREFVENGYFEPGQGLVDMNPHGGTAEEFFDDVSSVSTHTSRRVMREIIV